MDDAKDPYSNDQSDHNRGTPDPIESAHNGDEPTAPSRINLNDMVAPQQKRIEILLQHNTELLEWRGSLTSDLIDKFRMA